MSADIERKAKPKKEAARIAVRWLPVEALEPDPRNARLHPAGQVRRIADSIEAFGFNVPVLIDSQNRVVAGHGRVLAARRLALSEIPTIALDHLSEAERRAFMIADNRLRGARLLGREAARRAARGAQGPRPRFRPLGDRLRDRRDRPQARGSRGARRARSGAASAERPAGRTRGRNVDARAPSARLRRRPGRSGLPRARRRDPAMAGGDRRSRAPSPLGRAVRQVRARPPPPPRRPRGRGDDMKMRGPRKRLPQGRR